MRSTLLVLLLLASPATATAAPTREATSALQQVAAFDAELHRRDSATATLQIWCDAHGPGAGTKIVARRVRGADKLAGPAERAALKVFAWQSVAYRRVDLACGGKVLSRADNWYVPGRLTPAMNMALEQTQTPFGVVVRPLDFRRRTLAVETLLGSQVTSVIPRELLRHRAVLVTANGRPFSLVVETYTDKLLVTVP